MKYLKFIRTIDNTFEGDFDNSLMNAMIGYSKMYELLHKQLWRKNRVHLVDHVITFNGRACKPIIKWDIKDGSTLPYQRDDIGMGLDQFFVGQDPYSTYVGNPKDGIYHDDCYIHVKPAPVSFVSSSDTYGLVIYELVWVETGEGEAGGYEDWSPRFTLAKNTHDGDVIYHSYSIENVYTDIVHPAVYDAQGVLVTAEWTEQVLVSHELHIKKYGATISIQPYSLDEYSAEENLTATINYPKITIINESEHGGIIYETTTLPYVKPVGDINITNLAFLINPPTSNRVIVFADGTCVQIVSSYAYTQDVYDTDGTEQETIVVPARAMYLPLVYLDTGDLVQNRVDFVDNWEDMFELYVHEKSYWYQDLLAPFIIVVSAVIGYLVAPAGMQLYGAMAGFISGIGAVSGNKVFQIVGAIMSLYLSYMNFTTEATKEAINKEIMDVIAQEGLSDSAKTQILTITAKYSGMSAVENIALGVMTKPLSAIGLGLQLGTIGMMVDGAIQEGNIEDQMAELERLQEDEEDK